MSRNLLPSAIDYLATAGQVRIAHLVELELPNSTKESPVYDYLTDYSTEITYGSRVFVPDRIVKLGDIRQGTGLTNYKLSVDIAGEYQDELDRALNQSKYTSFVGKTIRVYRAYLDDLGQIIPFDKTTNGPMEYFFGNVSDIAIADGVVSGSSKVSWQCAGKFEDFNLVNGRITDDASHRGLESAYGSTEQIPGTGAKKEAYKTDTGFQHANQTINLISKYTTNESRYKMKSSWGGFKSKLVEYEVEVEKELELGVDLAAKYLPFIRGVRRVPAIPVFLDSLASDPSTLIVVYAICEGPASLLNLYVDGESALCLDTGQQETNMCLGNQRAGDTLSKFLRIDGGYGSLHDSYSPAPGKPGYGRQHQQRSIDRDYNIPIVPSTNLVEATRGLDTVTTFTITNSTGVKKFTYHPGSSDQAADSNLVSIARGIGFFAQKIAKADSTYWDENSRLLDTAYLVLEMQVTEEEQEIPELEMVVESHGYSGQTEQVTLSMADHLRDYITSKSFGAGLDPSEIDLASFDYVRDAYNVPLTSYEKEWVEYWRYVGWQDLASHTPKLLECNTILKTENTITKNVESLLKQMDATINQLGGKYHLSIEDDAPAIGDIHIDEVVGAVNVKDKSNDGKWNSIAANLIDPGLNWSANKLVFFDSNYLEQDKSVQKKGNVTFTHITNYYVARNWGRRQLDRSRYSREVSFQVSHKYVYLYPNANVTFTYPRFGWDKKKLRVVSMTLRAGGMVNLTLRDTDDSIYSQIDDEQATVPPLESGGIPRPNNLRVVSADTQDYDFPEATDNLMGYLLWEPYEGASLLRYEVEDWLRPGTTENNFDVPYNRIVAHKTTGDPAVFFPIQGAEVGVPYLFKVRTLDRYGNSSKYALVEKTFDSSELPGTYSPVTGFKAINTKEDGTYTGGDVYFEWDLHPANEVSDYMIVFEDDITNATLGQVSVPASTQEECKYTFYLQDNLNMYSNSHAGTLGAYRDYAVKIKAIASNSSSDWVYL